MSEVEPLGGDQVTRMGTLMSDSTVPLEEPTESEIFPSAM